jgi:hypothetical protein
MNIWQLRVEELCPRRLEDLFAEIVTSSFGEVSGVSKRMKH